MTSEYTNLCTDEGSFGPSSSCRSFDFSFGFTFSILDILPNAAFVGVLLFRLGLFAIKRSKTITRKRCDLLLSSIVGILTCLLVFDIVSLVYIPPEFDSTLASKLATAARALQLVVTILSLPYCYFHHHQTLRPSTVLFLYLFLISLFHASQIRSYSLIPSLASSKSFILLCISFAFRVLLLITQFIDKAFCIEEHSRPLAREETASFPSRVFFGFLFPLLWAGRKEAFSLDDLVHRFGIPTELTSKATYVPFLTSLGLYERRVKKQKSGGPDVYRKSIIRPTFRAFLITFLAPAIPKLGQIGSTFAQPYLVKTTVSFINAYSDNIEPLPDPQHGWALVGAYILTYCMIFTCLALYWDKVYTMVVKYRSALVSAIFEKSLRISSSVARDEGSGAALTYMSVDVERVCEGIAFFHETWSSLISIVIAAVVLWYQATYAMIPPIVVIAGFFALTTWVGKKVNAYQKKWMGSTQTRIKLMTSVASNIVPLKLNNTEDAVFGWAYPLRKHEIVNLRAFFKRIVLVSALSTVTVNFAGLSSLGTYVGISPDDLNASNLFSILTVVNIVNLPITTIGHCFPLLLASLASLRRIAAFLAKDDASPCERYYTKKPSQNAIEMDHASFAPGKLNVDDHKDTVLSKLTMNIRWKDLTMIVGPVGSGKSFLLNSILGETELVNGAYQINDFQSSENVGNEVDPPSISISTQDAFLWPTVSIKQNILFNNGFDPEWYSTVLNACELGQDLKRIQNADEMIVDDKGASFSGGQRQRISLARAVYAKADITILDDCFSALDSQTAEKVFHNLFSENGLLYGKTVILVTHSLHQLKSANQIIVVDEGQVVANGNFEELQQGSINVEKYITSSTAHAGEDADKKDKDEEQDGFEDDMKSIHSIKSSRERKSSDDDKTLNKNSESSSSNDKKSEGTLSSDSIKKEHIAELDKNDSHNVEDEKKNKKKTKKNKKENKENNLNEQKGVKGSAGWLPYKFYFKACGWKRLTACITVLVFYGGMQVGLQIYLEKWSGSGTTNHGPWLGGYAGFVVACFAASLTALTTYTQYTTPHASQRIHDRQLNSVLRAPVSFFQIVPPNQLVNRWSSDMNLIDFAFPRAVLDFTFTGITVIGTLVLIYIAVPYLAIATPFVGGVYYLLQKLYLCTSRQLQRHLLSSKTPLYTTFTSTLTGITVIRAFGAQNAFKDQCLYHLDRSQVPMYLRYAGLRFLRTALNIITLFVAVGIAAIAVGLRNSTSAGYLGIALSQVVSLSQILTNLLLAWTRVENGVVALERVLELTRVDPEKKDPANENNQKIAPALTDVKSSNEKQWPVEGSVEYRDFSFRYKEELEPSLNNVSFKIKGGSKLGICGRTGGGKSSTVFALLQGVENKLKTGQILIDGTDTSTMTSDTIRSSISLVSQEPVLLHITMRENLLLGCRSNISDNEIWNALDKVGMKEAVSDLENKLDQKISADGVEFSRGQRQLLCIARVLLQQRKIVVLDEASSSMDSETDAKLLKILKENLTDVTVISVAHRISTILDFDNILVMDEGKVVESGTPSDLLEGKNGAKWFKELARRQGISKV